MDVIMHAAALAGAVLAGRFALSVICGEVGGNLDAVIRALRMEVLS